MNWIDLLRMSSGNLKRRKLRTFLTVLGVIIGTTSIVVMISLGLGMQQMIYQEIEQSGGLNTITVSSGSTGNGMTSYSSGGAGEEEKEKWITDSVVEQFSQIEHVVSAQPVYRMSVMLLKGGYQSWTELIAMTPEGLASQNIHLAPGGRLPQTGTGQLELLYGNGIITSFADKKGNNSYYETGELPDIDLAHDSMFLVLDEAGYQAGQDPSAMSAGTGDQTDGEGTGQNPTKAAKKHAVHASGVVAGAVDFYNSHYYNVYCDLDTLKPMLKKEFSGRAIPGQPVTKSGKPYKEFSYTQAQVKVDDIHAVDETAAMIRQMGFQADTNVEYLESAKGQLKIIQAVLGGIGAVSLLVAAIGIANTMMMSIYERTQEIGVIKVLGCSLRNIKEMFLMEAAFIGLLGGAIGSILSYIISTVINVIVSSSKAMGIEGEISYIPLWLIMAAVVFAVFVGMAAGYFPALRAMRLSPLAAIRND